MSIDRYARHIGLFGADGQRRISATTATIVGLGGLGSHVAQQLAYLGVQDFVLIDGDQIEQSNLNRLIGALPSDVGEAKVAISQRMILAIQPHASVEATAGEFLADAAPTLSQPTILFGCVDSDVARLELVRYSCANAIPYIDLATDVAQSGEFGGRIVFAKDGERCLSCLGELDQHELARATMTADQRAADDTIYGVDRAALDAGGPSVVSVNGVIASLAITEFLAWRTGMREPLGYINYRGDRAMVGSRKDPDRQYCHYCMDLWNKAAAAGLPRG